MELTSKYILWIEDFAGDTFTDPDELDCKIDRSQYIKENFPSQFIDYVEVLEDPTLLPEHLEKFADNYELIVLDINFENGLSTEIAAQEKLICAFKQADITKYENFIPDSNKKELGYDIFTYLSRIHYPSKKIIFFSAYINSDEEDKIRKQLKQKEIPEFYNKTNLNDFKSYIECHLSTITSSPSLYFMKAKECFMYWKEKGMANDSIFFTFSKKINRDEDKKKDFENEITSNLTSKFLDDFGAESYNELLEIISKPFDSQPKESYDYQMRNLYYIMESIRHMYAHTFSSKNRLSSEQFLVIFCLGMRILFESQSDTRDLIPPEEWLINNLSSPRQKLSNDITSNLNSQQEMLFLKWYFEFIENSQHVNPLYFFYNKNKSDRNYEYSHEDIIHLFCFRAFGIDKIQITYSQKPNIPLLQLQLRKSCNFPHSAMLKIAMSIVESELKSKVSKKYISLDLKL